MLNSGKKIPRFARQKKKYSNSRVVQNFFFQRKKKTYPPCKFKWSVPNIIVQFGGLVFKQTIGIPMGINCAQLLSDLFLYANEADLHQVILNNEDRKLIQTLIPSSAIQMILCY